MVRYLVTISLFVSSIFGFSQRLNLGAALETVVNGRTNTVFETEPFYFLYAAPYSSYNSSFVNYSPYQQVRLVKIEGINSSLAPSLVYKSTLSYQSKNALRLNFGLGFQNYSDKIYYSFQNLVIDDNDNSGQFSAVYSDNIELKDDYINLSRVMNNYELMATYDITNNYTIKPFVLIGFKERIQLFSTYTSNTKKMDANDIYEKDRAAYYNVTKFQNDLYRIFGNNQFKHFICLGIGGRLFGFEASLLYTKSVFVNADSEFTRQQMWSIEIKQELISIPLFH